MNKIKRFALIIYLFLFLGLLCPGDIFAARNITITSYDKDTLSENDELNIIASPSGFSSGESFYIKGAFYQDVPSPNYFGYTKYGNNWIKNSDATVNQEMVKIDDWNGLLTVKSDFADSGYKGEGSYKFKIGFYSISNGKPSSVNWGSTILDLWINELDPTATPIPTNTPVPTSTPTPKPTPTNSPTPTPKVTLKPTQKPSPTISKNLIATGAGFLRESSSSSKIAQKPKKIEVLSAKDSTLLPKLLVLTGIVFIVACAIVFFYPYIIKFKNKKNE